uniref:Secreted protein n=1 Tax=Panagrellus redivivus TaxID=6233 RepID=A0A7E4UXY4_PANRE
MPAISVPSMMLPYSAFVFLLLSGSCLVVASFRIPPYLLQHSKSSSHLVPAYKSMPDDHNNHHIPRMALALHQVSAGHTVNSQQRTRRSFYDDDFDVDSAMSSFNSLCSRIRRRSPSAQRSSKYLISSLCRSLGG